MPARSVNLGAEEAPLGAIGEKFLLDLLLVNVFAALERGHEEDDANAALSVVQPVIDAFANLAVPSRDLLIPEEAREL